MATFIAAARQEGVCIEYSEAISRTDPSEQVARVVRVIRSGSARVLVAFLAQDFWTQESSSTPTIKDKVFGNRGDQQQLRAAARSDTGQGSLTPVSQYPSSIRARQT
ncbi:extracellular calcium-sensing receptor-like protein [Lates japonicus]|uniref:Extracellular calcium-sensing receptor-like protein n=1 Tax=Lates japonicus TaxID=270547 RepID=A0AAD3RHX7_LATJO|nr:extracellular calcium-sensing receptor-like protein [Lates japonicus]